MPLTELKKIAALGALLLPSLALAQGEEPGAARPMITTASVAPALLELQGMEVPTAPVGDDHPAMRLYHLAFEALVSGRSEDARSLLKQLASTYPGHPLAKRANDLLRRLDEGPITKALATKAKQTELGLGRDSPPNAFARAELVVGQTLHGIALGTEICAVAECDDARAFGATIIAGGGLGLAGSLLLTMDGITPGHAEALNTGTLWGAGTGFLLSGVINSSEERVIPGVMIGGQLLGLGVGHLAWRLTHASSGDISLASSTGFWGGFLATMTMFSLIDDIDPEPVFGTILGVSLAGLIGGAFIADAVPMSRGRVLVIDGGGIVGGLTGLGAALVIRAEDPAPYFLLTGLGAAGGVILTTYLTRDWDSEDDVAGTFNIIPTDGGAMLSYSMRW